MNDSTAYPDFNWVHFVQIELHQLHIKDSLEAMIRDAESRLHEGTTTRNGKTFMTFFGKGTAPEDNKTAVNLRNIRHRLAEVEKVRAENHAKLHDRLHIWLASHDERYRLGARIKDRYDAVSAAIGPMSSLFNDMRRRYGEARTEIGVAYDKDKGCLSDVGQASVDRLVASYASLMSGEERLVDALNALNTLVNNTMFVKLRLPEFQRCLAPECTPGMEYAKMRENFESGAAQVNGAIDSLEQYVARISRVDYDRDEILREYREAEWRRKLFTIASAA